MSHISVLFTCRFIRSRAAQCHVSKDLRVHAWFISGFLQSFSHLTILSGNDWELSALFYIAPPLKILANTPDIPLNSVMLANTPDILLNSYTEDLGQYTRHTVKLLH